MSTRPYSPREVVSKLEVLYGPAEWLAHHDALTELVLTILSQHTSDTNSGRAFMRLKLQFPTWEDVLAASEEEIAEAIKVGGLAAQKAPRIKAALAEIVARNGSLDLENVRAMPVHEAREWLVSLKGVGPKTAACILLFAYGKPALPVDTHVYRVAGRLGLVPEGMNVEKAHAHLEALVPKKLHYAFHISLIKHGRRLCRAQRPFCPQCPLQKRCPDGQRRLKSGDFAVMALDVPFASEA
ncbi:MAG TPA: endonuclease III [Dehalococcoidia bacterium]|nr:endonuclease III [Dehalococcoidia bacterium]